MKDYYLFQFFQQFLLHPVNYWPLFIPGYDFQKDFIYFASRNPGHIAPLKKEKLLYEFENSKKK